ncbi:MAG: hypothetical protein QM809_11495 [Gordonia sp. (in: high G+C Gram-positive bacteria)]|uniref:hypothetical protein n=1 Tax=Gordonia sp. (in: high G+C Gram-positive bacteria) TaxID=84139 RepID=UPI0039E671E8
MSTTPDNSRAYVWQDGDAFRAPVGTLYPTDPWAQPPLTGLLAGVPTAWDPFGGIQAGFSNDGSQELKKHNIFNKRKNVYAVSRGTREDSVKFRAVDYSKAAVLTALQGGSIVKVGDTFEWRGGNSEEFAFMFTLADPSSGAVDRIGFWTPKATLATPPPRSFTGEDLDGWEMEIIALEELRPISNFNPLGDIAVKFLVGVGVATAGTFVLIYDGHTTAPIPYDATPAAVKAALVALDDGYGAADWDVVADSAGWLITTPGGLLQGNGSALTGGALSLTAA